MLRIGIYLCLLIIGAFTMKGFRGPFELQAGQCPSIPYQDQFIPSRLKGRWYKHLYIDSFFDQDSICQGIDISPFVNGKTNIVFFDYSNLSKLRSRIVVEAHFDHSRITNQLHAPGFGIMEKELHILDTDYDNYFIIIGCEEFGNQHLLQVWVDTRKPYPNMNMTEKVAQVMNEKGFRSVNLVEVNNKNCGFSPF